MFISLSCDCHVMSCDAQEPEPVIKHTPKYIHTQEDDDFMANLDKMMVEDIQARITILM